MEDQIANTGRNQTGSEKCENVHKQTGFHLKITNSNNQSLNHCFLKYKITMKEVLILPADKTMALQGVPTGRQKA